MTAWGRGQPGSRGTDLNEVFSCVCKGRLSGNRAVIGTGLNPGIHPGSTDWGPWRAPKGLPQPQRHHELLSHTNLPIMHSTRYSSHTQA